MADLYAKWARVYDYFYPDRSGEVSFWARLVEPYGRRVLDLMCGTGEVSLGLARQGFSVTGVDLSAGMLAVGAGRLAAAADYPARNLWLAQGDACAVPTTEGAFDFALVAGNGSFNHLDDRQVTIALCELARVLRTGAGLAMELINPHLLEEMHPTRTFGPFRPTPPGVWVERTSSNRYALAEKLFHIHQVTCYEIDGQQGEFEECFALHVRGPEEIRELLEAVGFAELRFYGGHDLGAFDRWSSDLLVVATRS